MELAVDLHIHSALSPCADNDMTPNNIVNMAVLKGLNLISVTDHNNAKNLPAIWEVAVKCGIMLLPGIEVATKEEAHILCYFKTVDAAVEFGNAIYKILPNIGIDENIFGEQLLFDCNDNITGKLDKLLLSSANISVSSLFDMAKDYDGICIPAHVDRSSCSIISNLGFIPADLNIASVEISSSDSLKPASRIYPLIKNFRTIRSSDAHYLWDILERESFICLDELSMTNIFNYLQAK